MGKTIESKKTSILRPAGQLYHFLSDFHNFSHLMPPQVEHWQATSDDCSFEIRGLGTLGMRMTGRKPESLLVMKSEGKLPFSFTLSFSIVAIDDASSEFQLVMDAELNPFLEMMAKGPLQSFVDMIAAKLKEISENSQNL